MASQLLAKIEPCLIPHTLNSHTVSHGIESFVAKCVIMTGRVVLPVMYYEKTFMNGYDLCFVREIQLK